MKRARVDLDSTKLMGTDLLDRVLSTEGLVEVPVTEVPVSRCVPNPYQTRQHFDEAKLEELANVMRNQGFFGHLVARQIDDRYQIAYGERRLRAAKRAGLTTLSLAIRDLTDEQMAELAIIENIQRENLTPLEEARG